MPKRCICFALLTALLLPLSACNEYLPPLDSDAEATSSPLLDSDKEPARYLPLNSGDVRVTEDHSGELLTRDYIDANGVRITMQRLLCEQADTPYTFYQEELPADAVLRLYDREAKEWIAMLPTEGIYVSNTAVLELPDGSMRFFCLPLTFTAREDEVLEFHPELAGQLIIRKTQDGCSLAVSGLRSSDCCFVDFTMLLSPMPTLDWSGDNWAKMWNHYTDNGESLMCFSGYYRFTPDNYSTTGENCYYRCPAAFLARAIRLEIGKSDSAPLVTAAILDTAMLLQNDFGYFPTSPASGWLAADYGIGRGFYDTRFNTDLLELLLDFRARCGKTLFQEQIDRYMAFYMSFAAAHHAETENGGWLVADYWSPDMTAEPHTSLNHLIAECQQLYRLEDDCGDARYGELADRLLLAVEDTGADWVKDNHDLHYCRYTDGSYGAQDYPDLTYKDLTLLQLYLQEYRNRTSPTLDYLIREKAAWMDANGVKCCICCSAGDQTQRDAWCKAKKHGETGSYPKITSFGNAVSLYKCSEHLTCHPERSGAAALPKDLMCRTSSLSS